MTPASTAAASSGPALLSVVCPVYGCAGCLEELTERIRRAVSNAGVALQMILVDDASPDGAWLRIVEIAARHDDVYGIRLSRNFGQHYAIAAGIEHSRGNWVAVMDCDLQDLPEELPRLLDVARQGHDIVFGQRRDRRDSWLKRFGSFAFYRLLSYLTGVQQDHSTANFGIFSRKVIETVNAMPERDRCFPLMVRWTGFDPVSIPVRHAERSTGQSGYSFGKLVRLGLNIVLSYSDKPLRLVVKAGLVFSAIAVVIVFLSIYRYSVGDIQVAGFTSVIASIWLLGGLMILCIGVTGLYLGRLFNDAKGRPYYIIKESTCTRTPTP